MNDRSFMETMLLLEKGACDLFLHGTIESATSSVHQAFSTAQVEQAKVTAVKQKFSAQAQ